MQMQIFTQFEIRLDLSSALDTGCKTLINSLKSFVEICDVALDQFIFYPTKRSFSDHTGESSSSSASLTSRAPLGSILGPLPFSIY